MTSRNKADFNRQLDEIDKFVVDKLQKDSKIGQLALCGQVATSLLRFWLCIRNYRIFHYTYIIQKKLDVSIGKIMTVLKILQEPCHPSPCENSTNGSGECEVNSKGTEVKCRCSDDLLFHGKSCSFTNKYGKSIEITIKKLLVTLDYIRIQ